MEPCLVGANKKNWRGERGGGVLAAWRRISQTDFKKKLQKNLEARLVNQIIDDRRERR
jgi:hypothetical protein